MVFKTQKLLEVDLNVTYFNCKFYRSLGDCYIILDVNPTMNAQCVSFSYFLWFIYVRPEGSWKFENAMKWYEIEIMIQKVKTDITKYEKSCFSEKWDERIELNNEMRLKELTIFYKTM